MQQILRVVALVVALVSSVLASNPLATEDQRRLDILSKKLAKDASLKPLKAAARQQFVNALKKYGMDLSPEVSAQLDLAMNELVFSSVQKAVNGDPARPKVYWTDTAARTHDWFGLDVPGGRYSYDNPDCIYRIVPIDGRYNYTLKGRRFNGGVADSSFSLINNANSQGTVSAVYGKNLKVNDDGTYEITINSQESKNPNHLKSDWSVKQLFIRHDLGDWNKETPDELSIEIHNPGRLPNPRKDSDILWDAREHLKESTFFYGYGALDLKTLSQSRNNLKPPQQSSTLGTLTSQASSFTSFKLSDDEALVITLTSGKSDYWVLPVTSVGLLTNNPEKNLVSFNNHQAAQNSNGSYTFVLSAKDPHVYNWLSIDGMPEGTIMGRWQGLPPGDGTPKGVNVWSTVLAFDKLSSFLPKDTRYVSADERQKQISDRRQGYQRIHYQS